AHRFSAVTDRDTLVNQLVGQRLRVMAEKLCGGMMAPLLTHLLKAEALTPEERQELRHLIDELDRKNHNRDKPRWPGAAQHSLRLIGLAIVVVAAALAVIVLLVSRIYRRPALVHGLWVLVLLKLLSPPLVPLPVLPEPSRPVAEVPAPVEPDPLPEPQVARFEWADGVVEPLPHVPAMGLEAR